MAAPLAALDLRLLEILRDDGRLSISALSDAVSLSRRQTYARLKRLQDLGVLEGFSARIDSRQLGLALTAVITARVDQRGWRALAQRLRDYPELEYCAITSGAFDVLAIARVQDSDALRLLLEDRIVGLPEVRSATAMVVLDEVVRRVSLLPSPHPAEETR